MLSIIMICILFPQFPSHAEEEISSTDWRGDSICPSTHQIHNGILFCTGIDDTDGMFHVIVVDLSAPGVHFEYVMPEGGSQGHDGVNECRDPNVPL